VAQARGCVRRAGGKSGAGAAQSIRRLTLFVNLTRINNAATNRVYRTSTNTLERF
jgi:hypothetical protein